MMFAIYFLGCIVSYFVDYKIVKFLRGEWTKEDIIIATCFCMFSWLSVLSSMIIWVVYNSGRNFKIKKQ